MNKNISVTVKRGNLASALSIFRKQMSETRILEEFKNNCYYEKPTTKRRRRKKEQSYKSKKINN